MKEAVKKWKEQHKEQIKDYNRDYYLKHRREIIDKKTEYNKLYSKTEIGRAVALFQSYKRMDRNNGFDDAIDFDSKWIVENIFTKPCSHCGKEGWDVIGCNRIDNSKPHTKDNVEPCCFHCNCVLNGIESNLGERTSVEVIQCDLDGRVVKEWSSMKEAARNGFDASDISACCLGKRKTHKGFKWFYKKAQSGRH